MPSPRRGWPLSPADLCRCEIARAADRGGRQEPLHASLAAGRGALKFADELRLSEDEIVRIQAWVEQGAAEGISAGLPPMPKFVEALAARQAGRHCESDETLRLACEWLGQLLEFRLSHAR